MVQSRAARWAWAIGGWIFFALGVIGTLLPVMPTMPFMLLALWAFSRGSSRLEHWLINHAHFGPPLRRWRAYRVIPWSTKAIAWTSMAASLGWMTWGARIAWPLLALAASVMVAGAWYIARCPSRPPSVAAEPATDAVPEID